MGGFGRMSAIEIEAHHVLRPNVSSTCTVDQGAALGSAQAHLGQSGMSSNDSGMSGLFAQGLAMAQSYGVNKQPQDIDLDGDGVISAYERAYAQGGAQGGQMDANSMGAAAAMQAMKSFTGNGGSAAAASSGGNMQSKASHHACP
jgi:hypothetical protein